MFSRETAIAYARRLPRFRTRHLTKRHRGGFFVPQICIPIATRLQVKSAVEINHRTRQRNKKTLWVRVSLIRSEQMALRRDKLVWHINHYALAQKQGKYPGIIMVRGRPILWDGNHRVTAAWLLGKKFIRCDCYFSA